MHDDGWMYTVWLDLVVRYPPSFWIRACMGAGVRVSEEGVSTHTAVTHRVVEVSRHQGLLDRNDVGRIRVRIDDHLDALAELCELVPNVAHAAKRLELQKVFIAPSAVGERAQ